MSHFKFKVHYKPKQSRWKALLRPILIIPIALVFSMLTSDYIPFSSYTTGDAVFSHVIKPFYGKSDARVYSPGRQSRPHTNPILLPANILQNAMKSQMENNKLSEVWSHEGSFAFSPYLSHILSVFAHVPLPLAGINGLGTLGLVLALMILFRRSYPRWWFNWNQELVRFYIRILVYSFVMTEEYPSVTDAQDIQLHLDDPDRRPLNRVLPFVKWIAALPHIIIIHFLSVTLLFIIPVGWLCVIVLGYYPRHMFEYVEGVIRYKLRVISYCVLMITDEYPPFQFH